jgi:hypothetical protein
MSVNMMNAFRIEEKEQKFKGMENGGLDLKELIFISNYFI